MKRAEKRAIEALKEMRTTDLSHIDVYRLPNHREVARHIRRHIGLYPELYLSRRLYLQRRKHRFRDAARQVIRQNRARVEKWASIAYLLVIQHLREQYQMEYELGLRSGPDMSLAKAEVRVLDVYPTIARFER